MEIFLLFYPNMRTTNHLIPKIFGYVSFVHVQSPNRGKLDSKAVKCIFVGYSSIQKRYKCYCPPSKKKLSQRMLLSIRVSLIFPLFIFRGRILLRKTRIRIPISLIPFSLTLLKSLAQCLFQYLYPPLNLNRSPLSFLLRIE